MNYTVVEWRLYADLVKQSGVAWVEDRAHIHPAANCYGQRCVVTVTLIPGAGPAAQTLPAQRPTLITITDNRSADLAMDIMIPPVDAGERRDGKKTPRAHGAPAPPAGVRVEVRSH